MVKVEGVGTLVQPVRAIDRADMDPIERLKERERLAELGGGEERLQEAARRRAS